MITKSQKEPPNLKN